MIVMPILWQIRTALTAVDTLVSHAAILIMTFLALDHAGLKCTTRKTAVVSQLCARPTQIQMLLSAVIWFHQLLLR